MGTLLLAQLQHCSVTLQMKMKISPLTDNILKLFSYTFTLRYLSFCFSVAFSLEGDHLDPKIHSTHQGIWRGINLLVASPGLCWKGCDIYSEVSYSSVLNLPWATFFHIFFKQFAYLLFFPHWISDTA